MLCKIYEWEKCRFPRMCWPCRDFFTFIQQKTSNWLLLLNGWYEYEWNDVYMEMKIVHLNACEMCKVDNDEVKLLLQHLTSTLFLLNLSQLSACSIESVCVCCAVSTIILYARCGDLFQLISMIFHYLVKFSILWSSEIFHSFTARQASPLWALHQCIEKFHENCDIWRLRNDLQHNAISIVLAY